MIELGIQARRGNFNLTIECNFTSPWTVVFGPSGAGKSTLLRLIAGLDKPAKRDTIRIADHGQCVADSASGLFIFPGQRKIGLAAQQPALFPHLSVESNIAYGLQNLSRNDLVQRIASMLELVGATHLLKRDTRTLSGGEAQRISLARALAPMPQTLLLDEPLSALDAAARDLVLARLQPWLAEKTIQAVLVTHDAADALATGAEVALLCEGKLVALGPARTVLAVERERILRRLAATELLV